jgi:hypothetical protein
MTIGKGVARLIGVGRGGGEGSGGGRIRREGALENRTLDPVTLQQGVMQREREVWTQKYGGQAFI